MTEQSLNDSVIKGKMRLFDWTNMRMFIGVNIGLFARSNTELFEETFFTETAGWGCLTGPAWRYLREKFDESKMRF